MFKHIKIGVKSYLQSFRFIQANQLWHFFLLPAGLSLTLIIIGLYALFIASTWISTSILELVDLTSLPIWLSSIFELLIGFSLRFIAIWLLTSIFRYIILILLAPALAYVAQKTEQKNINYSNPFSLKQFFKDVARAIRLAIENGMKQILLIIVFSLLSFIPGFSIISLICLILIESYYLGFSMLDYTLELKQYNINQTRSFINSHRPIAIVNGLFFYGMLLIPIFGWMVGPILGVVAGNIAINKILDNNDASQTISYS